MMRSVSTYGLDRIAPAGFYMAVRVGFAFPLSECNRFPKCWVETYTREGLLIDDPCFDWAYHGRGAARWSALSDPKGVLERAAAFGLAYGAVCAVQGETGLEGRTWGMFARADREFTDIELAEIEYVLGQVHAQATPPRRLTKAELEALSMVKNGMLVKQMAETLGVSEGAIKQRLKNAKSKLNANNSTQAVTLAMDYGLI